MKIELRVLKAKIRGFELEATGISKGISQTVRDEKANLWWQKRLLGTYTRSHLIAYGILRGVPYPKIESKPAKDNQPNVQEILDIVHAHVNRWERPKWTTEKIADLLKREEEVAK